MKYPEHLLKLISVLKKLPGVGAKSAERFAFHLLNWPEEKLVEMSHVIQDIKKKLNYCDVCGCLTDGGSPCPFCEPGKRDPQVLCVVASPKDVFLIEETREFRGLYHVLGNLLSPLFHQAPPSRSIEKLKERVLSLGMKEVIVALDSTLEGDATALYLKKELEPLAISISRLALGLPMGSSFDYIDGGTLARALAGRRLY